MRGEEEEDVFSIRKGMVFHLRAIECRSSGSRRIVKTTTEHVSTPFCKQNFPLIDETTSYFRLNLLVWLLTVDWP